LGFKWEFTGKYMGTLWENFYSMLLVNLVGLKWDYIGNIPVRSGNIVGLWNILNVLIVNYFVKN